MLTQCVFIHSLVDGRLGRVQLLALVDKPAVDICAHLKFTSHVYTHYLLQRCKAATPVLRLPMGEPKRDEAVPPRSKGPGLPVC